MALPRRPKRIPIGTNESGRVYLSPERRSVHQHVMGASGQGKSKYLEHCIQRDIAAGHGVCLIDPEGDLYDRIVEFCALHKINEFRTIHLFDPSEPDWRFRFNPLFVHEDEKPVHRISNVIEALAQVWGGEDSRGTPAIRTTLRAITYALLEKGYSLAEAFYMTAHQDDYQVIDHLTKGLESHVMDEMWQGYQASDKRERMIEFSGARRRLSELLGDNEMREIFASYDQPIDFRKCMDNSDIVLVNLSPEAMGDDPARTFGALLVREMFYCAARRHPKDAKEKPFFAYIDECADFLTKDISRILARSRKRGLHVILAHQWLQQLREAGDDIYHGVMGIQNKVIFGGISDEDAAIMADQLFRTEYDLEVPISALTKPGVARYERTWFNNWSKGRSVTDGYAEGETESEGESFIESSSQAVSLGDTTTATHIYDADGFPTGEFNVSTGNSSVKVDGMGQTVGSTSARSTSYVSTYSETESESSGASESLVPVLQDFVGGVHSIENVRHMAISRLRQIPERNAVVKGFNTPTFDVRVADVADLHVAPENVVRFKTECFLSSPYSAPTEEVRAEMKLHKASLFQLADLDPDEAKFTDHPAIELSAEKDEDDGSY